MPKTENTIQERPQRWIICERDDITGTTDYLATYEGGGTSMWTADRDSAEVFYDVAKAHRVADKVGGMEVIPA